MHAQTLTLQVLNKPTKETLGKMFSQYAVKQVAIKDSMMLVQISQPEACSELIKNVKSGAFSQFKPEVFEILDIPANATSLMENYTLIFTTPLDVYQYFNPNEQSSKKQQKQNDLLVDQETDQNDHVKIDLLSSLHEPSGKIEIQFEDSAELEAVVASYSPPHRREVSQQADINQFCTASVEVVISQQSYEGVNNKAKIEQQKQSQSFKPISEKLAKEEAHSENLLSSKTRSTIVSSTCLTGVLLVWVLWLLI